MTELSEKIGQFLNRRKSVVSEILNKGGEQEAALLKAYGAPSAVDAMVSGAQQGALHGFADDIERSSRGDGVAQSQIRAKASNPVAYEIATLLGTMASAGGLRGGLALLGKQASAAARGASRVSGAAGSAQIAAKAADRAQRIEAKIATLGMKPQTRGMVMDAAHGAAWGYGGSDISADEKGGLNPERLLRAALGAGGATVAAPLTASAAVAGTNIPLTWGARRMFSKKMLEPPGVTKQNPAGRPRDAIEIARSRDESAARANSPPPRRLSAPSLTTLERAVYEGRKQGLSDREIAIRQGWDPDEPPNFDEFNELFSKSGGKKRDVDKVRNYVSKQARDAPMVEGFADPSMKALLDGRYKSAVQKIKAAYVENRQQEPVGIIARDTARPMQSNFPQVQKLADQAIAPVAPSMIEQLRAKARNASADAIEAQYPDPVPPRRNAGESQRRFDVDGEEYVVDFERDGPAGGTQVSYRPEQPRGRKTFLSRISSGLVDPYEAPGIRSREAGVKARRVLRGVEQTVRTDIAEGGRPAYVFTGNTDQKRGIYDLMAKRNKAPDGYRWEGPDEIGALRLLRDDDGTDSYVSQMIEAFVRRDRPALESWASSLEAAARKDPSIKPRIQAAVARQLAIGERVNPELNNDDSTRQFLNALGMWGNKAKGTPNVLEAARGPAREQFPTQRYEDALTRTADDIPMRPRHAERMRQEMETFEPGPYTGPADTRRGPPLVARGDDEPYWLNPLNFLQDGKVNDAEVNMAGFMSGPVAYGIERLGVGPATQFAMGDPEDVQTEIDAPPPRPVAARGALADVRPQQPRPAALPAPVAPRGAFAPLPEAMPPAPPAPAAQPAMTSGEPVRDIQTLLMQAGIDVGPEGDDGQLGPNTQAAMQAFARITNMPGQITPERVLARLQAYPRDALAEDLARALSQ